MAARRASRVCRPLNWVSQRAIIAFLLAALAAGCGRVETPRRDEASTQPTSTTVAVGGRLHRSYISSAYEERGDALNHFRVDPPPDSLVAMHTPGEVLNATSRHRLDAHAATAWFGVFAGNVMNPNAPDGRLTGVHWVSDVPAWIVITHDTGRVTHGKGGPPVEGKYTYDLAVFSDADLTTPLNGTIGHGGPGLY